MLEGGENFQIVTGSAEEITVRKTNYGKQND